MQVFFWVAFIIIVGLAIFAIQNSSAPAVAISLFFWRFETSLVYTILGSICLGILLTVLIWVPTAVRAFLRRRKLSRQGEKQEARYRSRDLDGRDRIP